MSCEATLKCIYSGEFTMLILDKYRMVASPIHSLWDCEK